MIKKQECRMKRKKECAKLQHVAEVSGLRCKLRHYYPIVYSGYMLRRPETSATEYPHFESFDKSIKSIIAQGDALGYYTLWLSC